MLEELLSPLRHILIKALVLSIIIASSVASFSKVIVKIADTVSSLITLITDAIKWQDVLFLNNTYTNKPSSLLRCSRRWWYSSFAVVKILIIIPLYRVFNSIHVSGNH